MTNDEKLKLADEILAIDDSYIDDAEDTFIGFQPRDTAFVPLTHALNLEALKAILTEWKECAQLDEKRTWRDMERSPKYKVKDVLLLAGALLLKV